MTRGDGWICGSTDVCREFDVSCLVRSTRDEDFGDERWHDNFYMGVH